MPKTHRGGQGSISQSHTGVTLNNVGGGSSINFADLSFANMTDNDAASVIKINSDAYDDPDFNYARKLYVSDANPNGDGYSFSQNLNYKLDNNLPLDANEDYMNTMLQNGMRPIGKDTVLTRAAHDDILKQLGISDYSKLSQAQLQQRLVGTEMKTTSYMSTSYDANKNPFLTGSQAGGREVVMKINTAKNTQMFFGAKAQSEVVLNKGTNIRIKNVYYDGTTAFPRIGGAKPRIVIELEAWSD